MADLRSSLARLDAHINHEKTAAGIAAGRVDGLSIEPMRRLMAVLGDPQRSYPVIHVTGTNGKGSVVRMIERLLSSSGLAVGAYTSPHLESVNERISRNGEPIADDDLAEALDAVLATEPLWTSNPSWFELLTATALDWFATVAVDVAVVEVGLLGRYDATNVVHAAVAVVTGIGPDHTDFAPGWEQAVASEKAGIITADGDLVVGDVPPDLRAVLEAEGPARTLAYGVDVEVVDDRVAVGGRSVSVVTPYGRHDDIVVPAHGAHQAHNAAVAIAAVEAFFDRALDDDVIADAFAGLRLAGRVEVVSHHPLVVLDGAHNAAAAEALAHTLGQEFFPLGSRIAVVGMLSGRRPEEVLAPLVQVGFDLVVATTPRSERAQPASRVAAAARELGFATEVIDDPTQAVRRVLGRADEEDLVVVAGSFYLVADARAAVDLAARDDRT